MKKFADKLKLEIVKGLPGTDVQWAMASSDRLVKDFPRVPGKNAAEAAVLIFLYPIDGVIHTIFIQRPEYNGVHGGQISFPGGKKEPSDSALLQTAIREASEETGIIPSDLKIVGALTPLFIPVSNTVVAPFVGWSEEKPMFMPEVTEVVFIIEADISPFLDYSIIKTKPFEISGEMINIKYFDYKGNVIWGATAMILNELLTIIKRGNISPRV
jgi:8-oxo-dGTP pyrophosphatase MutT (NUDIX family)